MSIKEKLNDAGFGDDNLFLPEEMDKGFIGIAMTDWHYGRPLYDMSRLEGVEVSEFPDDKKQPIFVDDNVNLDDISVKFAPEDGLNKAIVYISSDNQAVYEYEGLLEAMMDTEGWSYEDAAEWISFNTLRDYSYRDEGPIVYDSLERMIGE